MVSRVLTAAVCGVGGRVVGVEVDMTDGLPTFDVVGLPDPTVREAKEHVRSAIRNAGFKMKGHRTTVNLSPADLRKEGAAYDLPIALAVLAGGGIIPDGIAAGYAAIGELTLAGLVQPVPGTLPAVAALDGLADFVIVPRDGVDAAQAVTHMRLVPVDSLAQAVELIRHGRLGSSVSAPSPSLPDPGVPPLHVDLADIWGLPVEKRALEVAAAGGHNVLFAGPPGMGKTMLARALAGLLPCLSPLEHQEVQTVYSAFGRPYDGGHRCPVRSPHHSASVAALLGGGPGQRLGEVSLAHRGVLLLDELAEFRLDCIDGLREPMDVGRLTVGRAHWSAEFPSDFQLVATTNLCPCGNALGGGGRCSCPPHKRAQYIGRIAGALGDRIDIVVTVVPTAISPRPGPVSTSAEVASRVAEARTRQLARSGRVNARLGWSDLMAGPFDDAARRELACPMVLSSLSTRGQIHLARLARTIADLAGSDWVGQAHVFEAEMLRKDLTSIRWE